VAFRNLRTKTIAIALSGVVALGLSAAFADNLVPQDSAIEAPTAPIDETQTVVNSLPETPTVVMPPETQTAAQTIGTSRIASPAPSASPSATVDEFTGEPVDTKTVPVLIDPQPRITLHMPLSVGVDPRSHSYQMNSIEFWGAQIYLACFTGRGVGVDVGSTGVLDNFAGENFIVEGDRSPHLLISGTGAAIKALLHSRGGIRIFTSSGSLTGRGLSLSLTALNTASTEQKYCDAAKATSTSVFSPLQIDLGLVKGQGTLKK
jgi:hypothetical protein